MKLLLFAALSALGLFLAARYLERHSIYFPTRDHAADLPRDIPHAEVVFYAEDGVKLHGWYVPSASEAAGNAGFTALYLHGNAGNMTHRVPKVVLLRELGLSVFIVDYRGYGKSEGAPSERGLAHDARAAYAELLRRGTRPERLILYGESLGAAVAAQLAAEKPVAGFVSENAFTSIRDMARTHYPWVPPFLIRTRFDAASRLGSVTCPKLFFHTRDDEIVPFTLGERLYQAAARPKTFVALAGSHNGAFFESLGRVGDSLKAFLAALEEGRPLGLE
jgi:fermentation-respiration switch protein FrsA (DUF1100 family)